VIVSLLTDFGLADTYVGQMKAAILRVAPGATLVDLTHAVAPQDVFGGALQLWATVEVFPAGSVHLAVVDPGVGSERRAIGALSGRGDFFVGPDNGLLVPALERLGGCVCAVELTEAAYWRVDTPSATFHGRDIFGPVAGHLAAGVPLQRLGHPIEPWRAFELNLAEGLDGEVIHIDSYGNLITNIRAVHLPPRFRVGLGTLEIEGQPTYAAVEQGATLALVGSAGLLEISVRDGSAAARTGAQRGTPVSVRPYAGGD
jgi:S-adenosyl-L-methionine hydrolase (adenosine-forming)